jgi:hypothetical protein
VTPFELVRSLASRPKAERTKIAQALGVHSPSDLSLKGFQAQAKMVFGRLAESQYPALEEALGGKKNDSRAQVGKST